MLYAITRLALPLVLLMGTSTATAVVPRELAGTPPVTNKQVCTVANNTGPGTRICDFNGRLKKPGPKILIDPGLTFDQCRNACLVYNTCKSFSLNSKGKVCTLLTESIEQQNPSGPAGTLTYWDRTCYVATYYNQNATVNPGFETGQLSPWIAQYDPETPDSVISVVEPGLRSKHAAEFRVDNTANSTGGILNAYITQSFAFCKGVEASFSWQQLQVPNKTVDANGCVPYILVLLNYPNGTTYYSTVFGLDQDSASGGGNTFPAGGVFTFGFPFFPAVSGTYTSIFEVGACPGSATVVKFDNILAGKLQS